jgi:purine-binding chemotaxis protein CheW
MNVVVFVVADYNYGINVSSIREIIRMVAFKPLPEQPDFVEGVINLRGEIIPLLDFRRRFSMGVTEKKPEKRIIICRVAGTSVAFLVDKVFEVVAFSDTDVKPVRRKELGLDFRFVSGVAMYEGDLLSILETEKIFSAEESNFLADISTATEKMPASAKRKKKPSGAMKAKAKTKPAGDA